MLAQSIKAKPDVNRLCLNAPHDLNLKYAISFYLVNENLSQQQKNNLLGNSHVTDDVITLDLTW